MNNKLVIPGYDAAVDRESQVRTAAFFPVNEYILDIEVKPLTPIHYAILRSTKSPLIIRSKPDLADMLTFCWVVSPDYNPNDRVGPEAFSELHSDNDPDKLLLAINQYLSEAFQDAEKPSKSNDVPYFCDLAGISVRFALEFGWDDMQTLSKPLKRIYQYLKVLKLKDNPNAILRNPSDELRAAYLDAENAKLKGDINGDH